MNKTFTGCRVKTGYNPYSQSIVYTDFLPYPLKPISSYKYYKIVKIPRRLTLPLYFTLRAAALMHIMKIN